MPPQPLPLILSTVVLGVDVNVYIAYILFESRAIIALLQLIVCRREQGLVEGDISKVRN